MMAMHESGHVMHAYLSGGKVRQVSIPLWGFSFTELESNPHPAFVAWGGVIWGCMIPCIALGLLGILAPAKSIARAVSIFAGFCLIANGAYLLTAIFDPVGDAADLVQAGVSGILLAFLGAIAISAGLSIWHRWGKTIAKAGPLPGNH